MDEVDKIYDQFDEAELEQLRLSAVALKDGRPLSETEAAARAKWEALRGPETLRAATVAAWCAAHPELLVSAA